MRKSITIDIPEPCHEDWNKMTPKDQGRHCSACNKTVIDFTKQTDEQIIKAFESRRKLCGRFKTKQHNREIVLARKDKNNYLSWVASGLFAFMAFGNQEVHAQGTPKTVQTDSVRIPQIKGKVATSILNERIYVGNITTVNDGLPLPGTSVIVKGTSRGIQADFYGNFEIKAKLGDTLVFSYVGMDTQKIIISEKYNIKVALVSDKCYDEVVVGYTSYSNRRSNDCNNKKRKTEKKSKHLAKQEAIKKGEQERTTLGKFFFGIKSLFSKK